MNTTATESLPNASESGRALAALALKLIAAWLCSLAWGFGELTITHGLLYNLNSSLGLVKPAAPLAWIPVQGFIAMVVAPTVLGLSLSRDWRGLVGGLLSVPINLLTPILHFLGSIVVWSFAANVPELFDYKLLYQIVVDWSPFIIAQGIVTGLMIAMLVAVNGQALHRAGDLIRGLGIGLVLVVASFFILAFIRQSGVNAWQSILNSYWADGGRNSAMFFVLMEYINGMISMFLWQIPPLVWVTVIYFTEREKSPNRILGTVMWAFLLAATFVLPFVLGALVRLVY